LQKALIQSYRTWTRNRSYRCSQAAGKFAHTSCELHHTAGEKQDISDFAAHCQLFLCGVFPHSTTNVLTYMYVLNRVFGVRKRQLWWTAINNKARVHRPVSKLCVWGAMRCFGKPGW